MAENDPNRLTYDLRFALAEARQAGDEEALGWLRVCAPDRLPLLEKGQIASINSKNSSWNDALRADLNEGSDEIAVHAALI